MKKLLSKFTLTEKLLIVLVILLIGLNIWGRFTHTYKNELVSDVQTKEQMTVKLPFNDSLYMVQQDILLAQTQEQVKYLRSTLQNELFRKVNIGKEVASIEFRDSIVYVQVPNSQNDESDYYEDVADSVKSDYPLHFTHRNTMLKEKYTVYSKDSSSIDSLWVTGKTHIAIGETGKWYQRKTLKLALVNENPYIIVDKLQSVFYKPKERLQVTAGPILLVNKTSTSAGVGVNFKKGIFSFGIGYKIF